VDAAIWRALSEIEAYVRRQSREWVRHVGPRQVERDIGKYLRDFQDALQAPPAPVNPPHTESDRLREVLRLPLTTLLEVYENIDGPEFLQLHKRKVLIRRIAWIGSMLLATALFVGLHSLALHWR
jgi:hypothetical protein